MGKISIMRVQLFGVIFCATVAAASQSYALKAPAPLTGPVIQGLGGNCLDVYGGNPNPGARVDNFTCNGTLSQVFHLNDNYTITNAWGYCLDIKDANYTAGVLQFTTCDDGPGQEWQRRGNQIIGLAGKCLDVLYGNSTPGTTVHLASCNGTPAQNWRIVNPPVTLQGLAGHCLDVFYGNPNPGASVDNATCNGTRAQVFNLNADGTLTNAWSYCLDVKYANYYAGVLQFTTCNGTDAQQWQQVGDRIVGLAGECLDVLYGNTRPAATVHLTTCNGTAAQRWHVINTPTVLESAGSKCLDVIDSNTSPGARLQIFECNRGPNAQLFTFTAAGAIKGAAGQCLAYLSGELGMWPCSGLAVYQSWTIEGREIRSSEGACLSIVDPNKPDRALESALDHTPVGLAPCDGSEAQQWIAGDLYQRGPATLLIVTSDYYAPVFASFIGHKQAIGVSTKLITMEQARWNYPAADDALSLKYAIEDNYRNFGTKYVLLGGDNADVPVRYARVLDCENCLIRTHSFRISDLYYENLYSGHRPGSAFHSNIIDTWDSNGNGYYNETSWDNPTDNPDNVDGFPDVAVGRIPAYSTTALEALLTKIINYENQDTVYAGGGFPPTDRFGWVADACYGGAYSDVIGLYNGVVNLGVGGPFQAFAEEIGLKYQGQNCNAPAKSAGFLNDDTQWSKFDGAIQNNKFEWVAYVGHGGASAWGGSGTFTSAQTSQLSDPYQPIVLAAACQTAQFANSPSLMPLSYTPPIYDPNASNFSSPNIGSNWLFNGSGGAVAYVGENVVLQDQPGVDFIRNLFAQHANGYVRLGDMWRMAQEQYFDANYYNPGYDTHFSPPRIYLGIIGLLGDPSMRTP